MSITTGIAWTESTWNPWHVKNILGKLWIKLRSELTKKPKEVTK